MGALNSSLDGLYLFAGRADGSLAPGVKLDIGSMAQCSITSIALGDVNHDGRTDVIVAGNGSLQKGEYLTTAASNVVRAVDLDGKGYNALLGAGGGSANIAIWRQDASGTLTLSETVPVGTGGSFARDIAVADINGDGRLDPVAAVNGFVGQDVAVVPRNANGGFVATTGGNSPTSIVVFYQAAAGLMGPATNVSTYDLPMAVASADVDGDGRADIVVSHVGWMAVGVYLQQPSGLLGAEKRYAAPYGNFLPGQLAVGDFNHDGLPDIAIAVTLIKQLPVSPEAAVSMTRRVASVNAQSQQYSASLAAIGTSLARRAALGMTSR